MPTDLINVPNITTRGIIVMAKAGIWHLEQLEGFSESDIDAIKNGGDLTTSALLSAMRQHGIRIQENQATASDAAFQCWQDLGISYDSQANLN